MKLIKKLQGNCCMKMGSRVSIMKDGSRASLLCWTILVWSGCVSASNEFVKIDAGSYDNPYCIYAEFGAPTADIRKLSAPFVDSANIATKGEYHNAAKCLYKTITLDGRFKHSWCSDEEYILRLKVDLESVGANTRRWIEETGRGEYPVDHVVFHNLIHYMLDYQMYVAYEDKTDKADL